jgi:hypothetical protein
MLPESPVTINEIRRLEIACRVVPAPKLVRFPSLLGNYHQPCCTWGLNAPCMSVVFTTDNQCRYSGCAAFRITASSLISANF